jgi:hypothetical protein
MERDEDSGQLYWYSSRTGQRRRYYGRDTEKLALNTIKRVMAKHPMLSAYVQGDPRGCSLYILRPGDIPDGCPVDGYYSRGIAVYKE